MDCIINFLYENRNNLANLFSNFAENIYNNRDQIKNYIEKNIKVEITAPNNDNNNNNNVSNNKINCLEDENSKSSFYHINSQLDANMSTSSSSSKKFINNAVVLTTLAVLAKNENINDFFDQFGITYDFSKDCHVFIKDLCYCYADVKEQNGGKDFKYRGEVEVYIILKDEKSDKEIPEITENEKIEKQKFDGEIKDGKLKEYYKKNFDIKYVGDFNFELPNLSDLFKLDVEKIITSPLFGIELNGEINISKNLNNNFYCYGHSKVDFFIDNNDLCTSQICNNCIFIENGEFYKGDLDNFEKCGKGLYVNKHGLGIEGKFIDDNTIEGEVIIYNKKREEIGKITCKKTKIKDIVKRFSKKNKIK